MHRADAGERVRRHRKLRRPAAGPNFVNVYAGDEGTEAPDQLTDVGATVTLDWSFGNSPDFWVLTVKADKEGFVSSTCAKLIPKQVTPVWARATAADRLIRARQLARVR
jgi:hypothetical protein